MLESIPGEIIAKAAAMLPDAASAPDEPQYVEVRHGGHWIRIAFRRFMYTRGKMTRWYHPQRLRNTLAEWNYRLYLRQTALPSPYRMHVPLELG